MNSTSSNDTTAVCTPLRLMFTILIEFTHRTQRADRYTQRKGSGSVMIHGFSKGKGKLNLKRD